MTYGHRCSDVGTVVLAFEVALCSIGDGARVVLGDQIFPLGSHRNERCILLGNKGVTAILGKEVEELALASADSILTSETLEMSSADVGDYAVVRLGNRRQQSYLATSACAHLDNAELRVACHRKQGQRYANVVVEVTTRCVYLEVLGQDSAHQLLGCGLAVAAYDSDDGKRQAAAMFAC